jgi:hypothetical protein
MSRTTQRDPHRSVDAYPLGYQIPWSNSASNITWGTEKQPNPGADCLVDPDKHHRRYATDIRLTPQATGYTFQNSTLSTRDHDILRSVAALRIATAVQLQRLHYPHELHATALTAVRSSRRTFERLTDRGYLARLERRVGGARSGSASYCYVLGAKGLTVLGLPRNGRREPSQPFVEHVLATAELAIGVIETTRANNHLRLLTIETETDCWRSFTGLAGEKDIVKPDLFLVLGIVPQGNVSSDEGRPAADERGTKQLIETEVKHPCEDELHWFVELDRGTEHRPAIQKKLMAYERYYRSGQRPTGSEIFPRVLWSVAAGVNTRARVEQLGTWITGTKNITKELFVVREFKDSTQELKGEHL